MSKNFSPISLIIPLAMGVMSYWLVIGPLPLNPSNLSWIRGLDPPTHYLGWAFFRNSPFSVPWGLNPSYGLDLSSSIVFSDSIPLLALLLKPFTTLLPQPFQYFGMWTLICFVLQALFGWALMSLISSNTLVRIFGSGIILFSPILFYRIGVHAALEAHFLLLAAIYLNLRPTNSYSFWSWLLLLLISLLTHFYIFVMVFGLWLTNTVAFLLCANKDENIQLIKRIWLTPAALFFTAWIVGYFSTEGSSLIGLPYGTGSMNLLAPFNAGGWSYLLKPIPAALQTYEGFAYFGLGALLSIGIALYLTVVRRLYKLSIRSNFIPLLVFAALSLIFALSNHVQIGKWSFTYPLPDIALNIGAALRQSSRIFWPILYLVELLAIYCIVRYLPIKKSVFALAICFVFQVIDTSAGWWPKHLEIKKDSALLDIFSQEIESLNDPFWAIAAKKYTKLIVVPAQDPPGMIPHDWIRFASFAERFGLGTNSVYLARISNHKIENFEKTFDQQSLIGEYDPSALYILKANKVVPVLMHLNTSSDLLASINQLFVLAPGWKKCADCQTVQLISEVSGAVPSISVDKPITFSNDGTGRIFLVGIGTSNITGEGWAYPESFGTWSEGNKAKLVLPLPKDQAKSLTLIGRALINERHPIQQITILIDGKPNQTVKLQQQDGNAITINLDPNVKTNRDYIEIEFQMPNAITPQAIGMGTDIRKLGFGLVSATFK